jgi:hypothetical protein
MNLKRFIKEFNAEFGEPFLPKGFAKARIAGGKKDLVNISIGGRDADFTPDGECVGSGSLIELPKFNGRTQVCDKCSWDV